MATPESYGIDMGADTEATFGTSADSMGVCFKHTPGGELSGSLGGQPVSEGDASSIYSIQASRVANSSITS